MIKEEIITIFSGREKQNFRIYTNVAVGHGINGVDFHSFIGNWEYEDGDYTKKPCWEHTQILGFTDSCLVLESDVVSKDSWKCGVKTYFVPLQNIVSIVFFERGVKPYRGVYPPTLKKKNEFKDYMPKKNTKKK